MELHDLFFLTATSLGFITFSKYFLRFLNWIWVMFLRPPKNLKHYGSWAMITGSTDGIGKSLAFAYASKGLNLVLVGRNPSKLEETANEIHRKVSPEVGIRKLVIDLAKSSKDDIFRIVEEGTRDLDLGILVNNAGVGYPYAKFFHEVDGELMESLLKVNVEGPTWLTMAVLPGMLKKKRGAIVNIGSGSSAVVPSFPLYSIYAATKAYTASFSRCLNLEYKQHGIDIQCQLPLLVATKLAKIKRVPFIVPSPEMYSKASLRWVGHKEHTCSPYLAHSVQWLALQALPDSLMNYVVFNYFLQMRKRGLLKDRKN